MEAKKLMRWKLPSLKLNEPIRVCKICFKDFSDKTMFHMLSNCNVCPACLRELDPKFISFKVGKYKALAIYEYDDRIKSLLYQFKGCFDIETADIFLSRYVRELRLIYDGYVIVPIPSYKEDDEIREFNHVVEMFKFLKLKSATALVKTKKIKQANLSFQERQDIHKYLELIDPSIITNKKILLVDDVYTTGSTMKAAVELVEQCHPKKIQILVMSKSPFKETKEE